MGITDYRAESLLNTHPVRYLIGAGVCLALVALAVAYTFLGEVLAIKGLYAVLGLLLAAMLYEGQLERTVSLEETDRFGRWSTKAITSLTVSTYVLTYLTEMRLVAVTITLLTGYSLLAYQLLFTTTTKAVVPQIGMLFTIDPMSKYLTTGFYFGETDIFGHVRAIELLYRTGHLATIDNVYSTYDAFPALHVLSGAISSFTGLPAYDSLILLGIVTYTTAVATVFYLSRALLSPSKSVAVTLMFSILSIVHTYTVYFFPQAFATAIVVFLFYVVVRRGAAPSTFHPLLSLATLLVVGGLIFSHHVTQLIILGVVGVLYAPSILRTTAIGRRLGVNRTLPRFVPILFALTAGITHLLTTSPGIVSYFVQFTSSKAESPTVSDTGGGRTVFGLGTDIPYHTPRVAIESLFSIGGLYFIGLTALFVVGILALLIHYDRYAKIAGFAVLGVGAGLFVLRTPFVNVASRLALPLSLFFAFVAGIGLWQLTFNARNEEGSGASSTEGASTARRGAVAVVLVAVCVMGPLVAGDDLYGLHAGPGLWETYSTPEQQVTFSEQELAQFKSTVEYTDRYSSDVAMLWVSREASAGFGGEERSIPTVTASEGIRTDTPLVYRTAWTDHQVGYETDRLGTVSIADWWFAREINASNKVYTTGSVGIVGNGNGTSLSAN